MQPHVLYIGGEDHHLRLSFLKAMMDRGIRVTAAGSGDPAAFRLAGVPFVPFSFQRYVNPLSDLAALMRLRRLLREIGPDIAQAYDTKPCLLLPLAARGTAGVAVIRTICGLGWAYTATGPTARFARLASQALYKLATPWCAATIFEIDSDRAFFKQHGMAGHRSQLIPAGGGGIDVPAFEQALDESDEPRTVREEFGLGDGDIVITVSRITRQKGIPTLLEAAAIVHAQRPSVRFLLVGPRQETGPAALTDAEIRRHSPYCIATGPRKDVPALLKASDLFVFPTENGEGIPRALLESSLAGVPILATTMPGCRELLQEGTAGTLVPPSQPARLAEAILSILAAPAEARARATVMAARARDGFSIEAIANQHSTLYSAILNPA
jgi:glycosyltransferase involved in cell wall biosynthesis